MANAAVSPETSPASLQSASISWLMEEKYEHLRIEMLATRKTYVLHPEDFKRLLNEPEVGGNLPALVMAMLHEEGPNVAKGSDTQWKEGLQQLFNDGISMTV